jgi:hypothetical protein
LAHISVSCASFCAFSSVENNNCILGLVCVLPGLDLYLF